MICNPCRNKNHEMCPNLVSISADGVVTVRTVPTKNCSCQHRKNWNFAKNEGRNGDGS